MSTKECTRCDGCGQIANSDDGEPWTAWTSLPAASAIAIRMGLVAPIPCPDCDGSGVTA
jgi:RecJ-like exonuclease